MEKVIILHNPNAGNKRFSKSSLIDMTKKYGYKALYYSVKKTKAWKDKLEKADLIMSAGGDGTVRRIVKNIIHRSLINKQLVLAILPIGTANNISKALRTSKVSNCKSHFTNSRDKSIQSLDIGIVNVKKRNYFFLESSGFGVLALLIEKTDTSHLADSKSRLNFALKKLYELTLMVESHNYKINTESGIYLGRAILLEVVNSPYIGPNLHISTTAKLNSGLLDIVIVEENQRADFANHISRLIHGEKSNFVPNIQSVEKVTIETSDKNFHVDDELISINQKKVIYEIRKSVLSFFG